jgi:hypothetical protein
MSPARGRLVYATVGVLWTTALAFGLSRLWTYETRAGMPARAPATWPTGTNLPRTAGLPSLILLIHPHCPCSRATLGELSALMTACRGHLTVTVVMLRPAGSPDGWERTDLWDTASAIPGVSVTSDPGGLETRRFGAATSGQALLYAPDGRLLFAGGITESRGHRGDNAGRDAIAALVLGEAAAPAKTATTPVYGCPLSNDVHPCPQEGTSACPPK